MPRWLVNASVDATASRTVLAPASILCQPRVTPTCRSLCNKKLVLRSALSALRILATQHLHRNHVRIRLNPLFRLVVLISRRCQPRSWGIICGHLFMLASGVFLRTSSGPNVGRSDSPSSTSSGHQILSTTDTYFLLITSGSGSHSQKAEHTAIT